MSIEEKVLKHLTTTAAGRKKLDAAIENMVGKEILKLQNAVVRAQDELPFKFSVTNDKLKISADSSGNVNVKCDILFDHDEAQRDAFYDKGKYKNADLIYLFNNGWSYESEHPPQGTWHNRWTTALTERDGLHFVQEAVANYIAEAPAGVSIKIADEYE